MKTEFSENLKQAYCVREDAAKGLWANMNEQVGIVSISAECADSSVRKFENIDDLLSFENPRNRRIIALELKARDEDWGKVVTIDFGHHFDKTIHIRIDGDDTFVNEFRTKTFDIISGTRPWYSALHKVNFAELLSAGVTLFVLIIMAMAAYKYLGQDTPLPTEVKVAFRSIIFFGAIFIAVLVLGHLLNTIRDRFFPYSEFLIGQGKERHEHLARVQWVVGIGLLVSLSAGALLLPIGASG
ncbi:MAG: hypothetical protein HN478_01880 [Rhodospirillaceae bacterium]|jgi:hypothetical protein|nr:hypothetical protein [Rhodospirillaceae bacterium]MBT4488515.1 hypothetical protein [Rhodospirillaceae bacterium]MBT4689014.1 hypothetical protein [Rhodospirillaceae bacterium]MBT5194178.1 hypothetical protein [Rhodospirillaceae bacterium]MBT5899078.1 hypothetical protein [Rhodospirillaceae bacterium]